MQKTNPNFNVNTPKNCQCESAHFCHKQFPCSARRIYLKTVYINKQFVKIPRNYLAILHIKKLNLFRRYITKSFEMNKQNQRPFTFNKLIHKSNAQKQFVEPFTFSFYNKLSNRSYKQCNIPNSLKSYHSNKTDYKMINFQDDAFQFKILKTLPGPTKNCL